MPDHLVVNEIYLSLQGESTFAGLPCIFVRLTACNLRCSYCDTTYAFSEGKKWTLDAVADQVDRLADSFPDRSLAPGPFRLPLVELTGGEPLLQKSSLPLMRRLCDRGYTVLLETSGALDISAVDSRVRRIMDLKCPSSGESDRNCWQNIQHLTAADEVKFVIGTQEDYDWAKSQIAEHRLDSRCALLVSWVHPAGLRCAQPDALSAPLPQQHESLKKIPAGQKPLSRQELAERIMADALPVRFQVQMHKIIWPAEQRGV